MGNKGNGTIGSLAWSLLESIPHCGRTDHAQITDGRK